MAGNELRRVLLIEREDAAAGRVEAVLCADEPGGFSLTRVIDLGMARPALQREPFDALLLGLPPGDRALDSFARAHAAAPGLPCVVLLDRDDPDLGSRLVQAGAQDCLVRADLTRALLYRSIRYAAERGRLEAELERERDAALLASQAKSRFLAAMSHEIRTPLNSILGTADLLLESGLDGEQQRHVEAFMRGGEALLHVINGILDLSKIEADQLELEAIEFAVEPLVESAADLLAQAAHKKGLALVFEVDPAVPHALVGDPNRLRQVLVNLLSNAVKFTDCGEVSLCVRVPEGAGPGQVEFSVADTGIGIGADKLHAIFEPFTQADASITRRFGGTGLGLTLCARLAERMGGRLSVDSRSGRGSIFRFVVDLEPGRARPEPALLDPGSLSGVRALVADDADAERRGLARLLAELGAEVIEAHDGEAALAIVERCEREGTPPGLLLLDARMPGLGGLDLAALVSSIPGLLERMVILFATDRRRDDLERCAALGVARWIEKPVKRGVLHAALAKLLGVARTPTSAAPVACEGADVRPLDVLVVDDSEDNRALVAAFLEALPYRLHFAEDGVQAVEACRETYFDVVLMDMQMPRLDGFGATRSLRQLERRHAKPRSAVVALTAHAFLEDRKACLEAGCDAYLAKPVRKHELLAMIQRMAGGERVVVGSDPELSDLVEDYLERRRGDVCALRDALEAADFDRVRRLGHDMKGTGAGYGFDEITRIGRQLETAGAGRDGDSAAFALERLGDYLRRVEVRPGTA